MLYLTANAAILALHPSRSSGPAVVELRPGNASPDAQPAGIGEVATRSNYYFGQDPSQWHSGVPHYSQVRYRQIYPGIDMVFHGAQRAVEYDFVVHAGADPAWISLDVRGAEARWIDASGNVVLATSAGTVQLRRPVIYQEHNGGKTEVPGGYVLARNGRVRFRIGPYDKKHDLVVDPVLSYSTYLGANNDTELLAIAVDSAGSAYVTGETFATNFPTKNPVQAHNAGSSNAFVTKFNSAGNGIIYSTYFGGTGFDHGVAIAVDSFGSAYLAGGGSAGLTTTPGAFMSTCPSICNTPFVAKFNTDGTLAFSTFTGASNASPKAIALDANSNSYVVGVIASNDLPVVNPLQPVFMGPISTSTSNAYIQKLNATGTALEYSTYFGGSPAGSQVIAYGIAVDSLGSAYVVGTAGEIPVMNPLQAGPAGKNAFISKLSPDGTSLIYSTYFGGSGGDEARAAAVDPNGNLYVIGVSGSTDFPLTPNAFQTTCVPAGAYCESPQVFATKLDSTGTHVVYSTFLGTGNPGGLAVDAFGNAYISGKTADPSFPVSNAIENSVQQGVVNGDAFVIEVSPSGALLMSTLLGGRDTADAATGIAVDQLGNIYVGGLVEGSSLAVPDFPILNPFQPILGNGANSGFVAKISPPDSPAVSLSPLNNSVARLRNMGTATLTLNRITTSPNLTHSSDCAGSLLGGTGCTLVFTMLTSPAGTVTISSNAAGSPQTFPVMGSSSSALLVVSTHTLSFGTRMVGIPTPSQFVTLSNPGPVAANIGSIQSDNPVFSYVTNCPAVLNPSLSCNIEVTFTPAISGAVAGTLSIFHDPVSSQDVVSLGGTGIQDAILVSTTSLSFGTQYVGVTPLPRRVTLTNISSAPVAITSVAATSDFSQTNTCGDPVLPGSACQVSVSFVPSINNASTGTLTIAHTGGSGPENVDLFGVGRILSDLMLSPLQLTFAYYAPGTTSPPSTVMLTNTGSAPMSISNIVTTNEFPWTTDCPATLGQGVTCNVNVSFAPAAEGTRAAILSIFHSGVGSPQVIALTGYARYPLSFTPPQLDFGNQSVGITSGPKFVSAGNNSSNAVAITSVGVSGDFQLAQNFCPPAVPTFYGCTLQITFTPTTTGTRNGTLSVVASDDPSPHVVPLTGVGVRATTICPAWGCSMPNFPVYTFPSQTSKAASGTKLSVSSNPDGADIAVDGNFVGNTPAVIKLAVGEHTISVKKTGYTNWKRKVTITGGEVRINAELEKSVYVPRSRSPLHK